MPNQVVVTKRVVVLERPVLVKPKRPTSFSAFGSTRMIGRELPEPTVR